MADKEFLERMLSMLPEEFQEIYDDTIPEAKEITLYRFVRLIAQLYEECISSFLKA